MQTSERTVAAPFGGLRVTASEAGVRAVSFLPDSFRGTAPKSQPTPSGTAADAVAERAAAQLIDYLAGRRRDFDLPLDWDRVVSFRRQVLDVLYRSVGYGETVSYRQLAERAGQPDAARVVGQIMGSNPLPVVVPCHRVTASGGELGGFGGGLETKRWLLELEGSLPPRLPF